GTQVRMSDGSLKAIEDIAIGDRILSYNEESKSSFNASVTQTLHHSAAAQSLHTFYMADGRRITSNDIHVIFSVEDGRYVPAADLAKRVKSGETIHFLSEKGTPVQVSFANVKDAFVKVYNLHVDGIKNSSAFENEGIGHNYFVDGLLVHNMGTVQKQ
ncbi:MAG: hypothetical protein EOP06_04685, partial [Proteobacteria bacterium]